MGSRFAVPAKCLSKTDAEWSAFFASFTLPTHPVAGYAYTGQTSDGTCLELEVAETLTAPQGADVVDALFGECFRFIP